MIVAAYGDQQQQRSYRPGGGRGGGRGGGGRGGGRYGQRDRRNQSWDRRNDKKDDDDYNNSGGGYASNNNYYTSRDSQSNSNYDPRNDAVFGSSDDGDASWDGGYSAGAALGGSGFNQRGGPSRNYGATDTRDSYSNKREDGFSSYSRESDGSGGRRGRGSYGRGEGRRGGGRSSSYGGGGRGRSGARGGGGERYVRDRYSNNSSRERTSNYSRSDDSYSDAAPSSYTGRDNRFNKNIIDSDSRADSWSNPSGSSYDEDDFNYERNTSYDRGNRSFGGSSIKDLWQADVVFGVSPVLAALEAGRRTIHTLYVQEGVDESKRKDKGAVASAMERAKQLGAIVKTASKHDLNMVSENRPHQGLILDSTALDFEQLDAMPAAKDVWDSEEIDENEETRKQPPVWLCLDEVVDPQNFGAALRSAFFLGATGVLTCKRNSAPLSPVVSKASAGALELMPVHSCRNLPQTLADAKVKGWTVLGAAAQSDAISCATYKLQGPTILVMGNEGYGLRTTVRQQCDAMLRIDGAGGESGGSVAAMGLGIGVGEERMKKLTGLVESLNVSVATGILMHQLLAPK